MSDCDQSNASPEPPQTLIEPLTDRELEVLKLIGEGYRNREIADRLAIGMSTVKKHINRIFSKLGVDTRARAIVRAQNLNLLTPSPLQIVEGATIKGDQVPVNERLRRGSQRGRLLGGRCDGGLRRRGNLLLHAARHEQRQSEADDKQALRLHGKSSLS